MVLFVFLSLRESRSPLRCVCPTRTNASRKKGLIRPYAGGRVLMFRYKKHNQRSHPHSSSLHSISGRCFAPQFIPRKHSLGADGCWFATSTGSLKPILSAPAQKVSDTCSRVEWQLNRQATIVSHLVSMLVFLRRSLPQLHSNSFQSLESQLPPPKATRNNGSSTDNGG